MRFGLRSRNTGYPLPQVAPQSPAPGNLRFRRLLLPIFLLLIVAVSAGYAQSVRVVQGVVRNESDQPQANAVVYLQDQKSLEVRTYITEADGHYRFGQLGSDVDYQLWAELKGHKSKTRSISSFDSKKQFLFDLKVDGNK